MAKNDLAARPKIVGNKAGLDAILRSPNFLASLTEVLPEHFTPELIIRLANIAHYKTPFLYQCTQMSVAAAIIESGSCGLDCSGRNGEGYLIPFKHWKGYYEAKFIPGYPGLLKLHYNTGGVDDVRADEVHQNDEWDVDLAHKTHPIRHKPLLVGDRGKVLFTYCLTFFSSGAVHPTIMTLEQTAKIKEKALSKIEDSRQKYSTWVTHEADMRKKSAVRKAANMTPKATENVRLQRALQADNFQYDLEPPRQTGRALAAAALGALTPPKDPEPEDPQADDATQDALTVEPEPEPETEGIYALGLKAGYEASEVKEIIDEKGEDAARATFEAVILRMDKGEI